MEDLKDTLARNICELRKKNKLTQVELAEKLNYSDKAISKWERGESVPDIYILKDIASLFDVSIDDLISKKTEEIKIDNVAKIERKKKKINIMLIACLSAISVWIIPILVFFAFGLFDFWQESSWLLFIYALPLMFIVLTVFSSIWGKTYQLGIFSSLLLWSAALSIFLTFYTFNKDLWQVFIICVPVQLVLLLTYILLHRRKAIKKLN